MFPIAPMGKLLTCLPQLTLAQLQTMLWSTTGGACHRDLENFPSPQWESLADMFNLTLAFQLGGIHLLFYQGYVRTCKTPSCSCSKVPMETNVLLVVCIGRRSLRLFRHSLDNVFLDHRQHSFWFIFCACLSAKLPIAPMGKLLTCLPRLTLAQLRPTLPSTTGGAYCRDLERFPLGRWENADALALILACTTVADASVNFRGCVLH